MRVTFFSAVHEVAALEQYRVSLEPPRILAHYSALLGFHQRPASHLLVIDSGSKHE